MQRAAEFMVLLGGRTLAWMLALTGLSACNPGPAPEFPVKSGGVVATGGVVANTGGATSTGGTLAAGGTFATGGVELSTGGAFGSGGNANTGGSLAHDGGVEAPDYVTVPTDIPCDVAQVLNDHCWECHNVQTNWTAPMSLVTRSDFAAQGKNTLTEVVAALAKSRIHNTVNPMPPSTRAELSAAELQVLDGWLDGDTQPSGGNSCEVAVPGQPQGTGGTIGGDVGMLPNETCYQFLKHGGQTPGDTTPHPMGPGEDYINFYYKVPWTEPVVATRWRTIYDKTEILHHWLMYQSTQSVSRDGQWNGGNSGAHPGAKLLAVWAVGGGDERFPEGVGLEMPAPGALLEIEWHLYNTGSSTVMDRSGIELCVVPKAEVDPGLIAGVTWLGTEQLNIPAGQQVKHGGVCTPSFKNGGPINIVKWMPHMHLAGRHMDTWLLHDDGSEEYVFNESFLFDSQIMYDQYPPLLVKQGDRLHAQCTFKNDTSSSITFGESTTEEMCYQFVFAYPVGSLAGEPFATIPTLNGSDNTCLSFGPVHP